MSTNTRSSLHQLDFHSLRCHSTSVNLCIYKWSIPLLLLNHDFQGPKFTVSNESENSPWHLTIFSDISDENHKEYLSIDCSFDREALQIIETPLLLKIYIIDENEIEQMIFNHLFIDEHHDCKWMIKKFIKKKYVFSDKNAFTEDSSLKLKFQILFPCKVDAVSKCNKKLIRYERMLNNEEFSDMKIAIGDKEIYVHKVILASQSPIFAAMFKHNMKEKDENIVQISDISYEVMQEMLRFIYAGKVNNIEAIARDLLIAADKYDVQELKVMCEDKISNYLSMETVISTLSFAEKYGAKLLKERAIQFFLLHAEEIVENETYIAEISSLSPLLSDLIKALVLQSIRL